MHRAAFGGATFEADAEFVQAIFLGYAWFAKSMFEGFTIYPKAIFKRGAYFAGIRSERAFSLADATIHGLPDFIQAHFAEAPRLDNLHLRSGHGREENASAKWRALKRLAIQGHDHEREQDFFAGEIKSQRFVTDFPLTWRIWSGVAWAGVARWWFGWAYQIVSGFGRSLARPLAFWLATITLGALYFLGQHPDVAKVRAAEIARGAPASPLTYATVSWDAWTRDQPCYAGRPERNEKGDLRVSGLDPLVRDATSAATEAMHLALRNAFIFLDGAADAAHRTFGCLYGVERYGDNPVAIVPSTISFASALQKAFSAILIFLFGLAVRNMLRMK